ncbi:hypothetical protein VCR4J5_160015 [Vibrio crassostreae]|uniref:Uncharacterized protein n=1 Tax=Vibrio crassostreae TaxID=246167 RepID=A0ABM9QR32_9VIBR|nr:hypothetical protein VCRA2117O37_430006 [Vibrio crassostreae]CAK3650388.1 hypothetical protein VCRA2120O58_430012 [Vibrio crassostreae]CAK3967134.1 hypothetical protein VCRA2121O66_480012 [Vibrio crassostreae]CDT07562.1 hypothetical protein VCR19J5_1220025 [Vibrio crassostreae]CDT18176.1 hypothetical protein VCR4J5_160015 [Vibrio crassostreae]
MAFYSFEIAPIPYRSANCMHIHRLLGKILPHILNSKTINR